MSTAVPYTESWQTGPQSTQFYTRTYSPPSPKALIVAIHGFIEHIGRFTHMHTIFLQNDIAVFAFDQRGFGKTAQDKEGNKSKESAYGKTSWKEQMDDINWALSHSMKEFPDVPTFLMGQSMGGGEALGFATQGEKSGHYGMISSLSGVIVTSPLIRLTRPPPKPLRWIGQKISLFAPYALIPVPVTTSHLSHDKASNKAYRKDKLIRPMGSLRNFHDMFYQGKALLESHYKNWPPTLPVLLIHGTKDKVTSHVATQKFHDKLTTQNKKLTLFTGGYHELQNEPNGVKEKLVDDIITFVKAHSTVVSEVKV